ncbi:Uncharacterised protein [Vibrio cholerae]|nr:Uncharacterised protein [Vibrio cholerae]
MRLVVAYYLIVSVWMLHHNRGDGFTVVKLHFTLVVSGDLLPKLKIWLRGVL